jgi:hypothetical protein
MACARWTVGFQLFGVIVGLRNEIVLRSDIGSRGFEACGYF